MDYLLDRIKELIAPVLEIRNIDLVDLKLQRQNRFEKNRMFNPLIGTAISPFEFKMKRGARAQMPAQMG